MDVEEFREAADSGRWADALSVYRGPFLPGFYLDAPKFESWVEAQRGELERLQRRAHQELLREARRSGDMKAALDVARRWVTSDPLHDEARRYLLELLAAAGQRSEALQQYSTYERRLKKEYDLEPRADIQELVEQIRRGDFDASVVEEKAPVAQRSAAGSDLPKPAAATPESGVAAPSVAAPATFMERARKRRIVQVLVLYLGFAAVSIDVADVFNDKFGFPPFTAVLVFLAVGLVAALFLAWTEEQPERAEALATSGRHALSRVVQPVRFAARVGGRVRSKQVLVVLGLLALTLLGARESLRPRATGGLTYVLIAPYESDEGEATGATAVHAYMKSLLEQIQLEGLTVLDATSLVPEASWAAERMFELGDRYGAEYIITGKVWGWGDEVELETNLHLAATGRRIGTPHVGPGALGELVERAALRVYEEIAEREGWPTVAPYELGEPLPRSVFLQVAGLEHFRRAQFVKAAEKFRLAIAADTGNALAYFYLSLAEHWRRDPTGETLASAKQAIREALKHGERLTQRGLDLLRAQQAYLQGDVAEATSRYEAAYERYPDDVYAYLGLAESYHHFGPYAGRSPDDAREAWEQLIERVDSTFAPAYYHLADLALLADDSSALREHVESYLRFSAEDPEHPARRTLPALRDVAYGRPPERAAALENLPPEYYELIKYLVRGGKRLGTADSVALRMTRPDQLARDRQRGHEYRFVTMAALGRWSEALEHWQAAVRAGADPSFNPWVMMSYVAGYLADSVVMPMIVEARERLRDPAWPADSLSVVDLEKAKFRGLVQHAALHGDSAEVQLLLNRIARRSRDPYDPLTPSYQGALNARLGQLAADTTALIAALRRALTRFDEPSSAYLPTAVLGRQRLLLAELLIERGDYEGALRWLESFEWSFAIIDVLFLREARALAEVARARMQRGR